MSVDLEPTLLTRDGVLEPTALVSTGEDIFIQSNDGLVIVRVNNPTLNALPITFFTSATISGQALADTELSVDPETTIEAGPFPPVLFNQDDDSLKVSASADLELQAFRI